jgi:hypothetical protein
MLVIISPVFILYGLLFLQVSFRFGGGLSGSGFNSLAVFSLD